MQDTVKLWWYRDEGNNTGDLVGPWIYKQLGINYEFDSDKSLMTCGSILNLARDNSVVWGSGLHNATDKTLATNIKAVRGNLTKDLLNVNVPVGDPGLLVSRFYKPTTTKKYKFGIVSHWVDYPTFSQLKDYGFKVISMRRDESERPIEDVLDDINECEFIFSSSLHGIIFAHSLGIPAVHLENNKLFSKDNFKFRDYYSIYKSVSYIKEQFDGTFDFIEKYLSEKEKYVPDPDEVSKIQKELLEVMPYAS